MRYYNSEELEDKFEKQTKNRKIEILEDALSYMRQYNGRSRSDCIALAMDYESEFIEGETHYYKPRKKIMESEK